MKHTVQTLVESLEVELKYNPADVPVRVALEPAGCFEQNLVPFLLVPSLNENNKQVLVIQPIT